MRMQLSTQIEPIATDQERRWRRAAGTALTRVAWDVREALVGGMRAEFDRPTPFTLRAFQVQRADAKGLEAIVWAQPKQAKYLATQIEGGARGTKPFEYRLQLFGGQVAIPGAGAKRNQYGNMSLAFIKDVGSDLNSGGTAKRFFQGTPKGWLADGTFEGVWARVDNNNRLVRVMQFAEEAQYQERFEMSAIAKRTVDARFESQLMRALQEFRGVGG